MAARGPETVDQRHQDTGNILQRPTHSSHARNTHRRPEVILDPLPLWQRLERAFKCQEASANLRQMLDHCSDTEVEVYACHKGRNIKVARNGPDAGSGKSALLDVFGNFEECR